MEEELNFEDLYEGLDKSKFPEVLLPARRNARKEIIISYGFDRFVFNNLVLDNASQTADN